MPSRRAQPPRRPSRSIWNMEEDNPTCEHEDYEIHELKVMSQ
jgi:hypothetical protein